MNIREIESLLGADAASPQPVRPLSASIRTKTLSARATVSPDICTGFFIGKLTAMGSMDLIFTASLGHAGLAVIKGRVRGEL